MNCAYCNEKTSPTREHIIPCNMFPIIQTSIGQGVSDIIWSEKTRRQKDFWKEAEVEWNAEEERIKKENPRK